MKVSRIIIAFILGICLISNCIAFTSKVPLFFDAEHASQWKALSNKILTTKDKEITLLWEGHGGENIYVIPFVESLCKAKKQHKVIKCIITGQAISFHAVVPVFASSYKILPQGSLRFHGVFMKWGYFSPKIYLDGSTRFWLLPCVHKGMLSEKGFTQIIKYHKLVIVDYKHKEKYVPDYK